MKFKNQIGSIVNVDEETAAQLGPGWESQDSEAKQFLSARADTGEQDPKAAKAAKS